MLNIYNTDGICNIKKWYYNKDKNSSSYQMMLLYPNIFDGYYIRHKNETTLYDLFGNVIEIWEETSSGLKIIDAQTGKSCIAVEAKVLTENYSSP